MVLREFCALHDLSIAHGDASVKIEGLALDSRKAAPGYAFFAIAGTFSDGHDYIGSAIQNGAIAIFCTRLPDAPDDGITYVEVGGSMRRIVSAAADYFYNSPSRELKIVGVTGTNGKSSVVTLLHDLFTGMGIKSGLLSTIENKVGDVILKSTLTTPDPIQLHRLLRRMKDEDCGYCFMEVSSHALDQDRVADLSFHIAAFTNLSHDHIGYHGSFDAYIAAKKKLFDALSDQATALINVDDRRGRIMVQNCEANIKTMSISGLADYRARILENGPAGLHLVVDQTEMHSPLMGRFNAYNLLTVYAIGMIAGLPAKETLRILSSMGAPPGRFEAIRDPKKDVTFIVDYAHTPDALRNVLEAIRKTKKKQARTITVVGCGGNRDRGKRPAMGKLAAVLSDFVILTSDNPRDEDPEEIIADMAKGIPADAASEVLKIVSREEAIRTAYALADKDSIVLVAGKGHEDYQEIKGERRPFHDQTIIRHLLKPA
ncbi:MAG: UDP-N-acetylmuramoyl-L-alanyl-D-glutamate--2,6-diaminopimelate ligase [Saprospiraceae bacterium]|nr:UDP-N-acetylmuramoyl-L-alanyl-D-glutamate--2,6-diaminopimelate ligase [Saprospiraceae bacterium]